MWIGFLKPDQHKLGKENLHQAHYAVEWSQISPFAMQRENMQQKYLAHLNLAKKGVQRHFLKTVSFCSTSCAGRDRGLM